jgi:hypothetical protein
MITNRSFFGIACRVAAFSFLMAGSASLIEAQQPSSAASPATAPLLLASSSTPLDLTAFSSSSNSSSSSSDATPAYAKLDLDSAALGSSQPPPRRTYGRPTYAGGNTNPDGSPKYFALFGFAAAVPVGITHKYETLSWGLQAGVGKNFSKTLGVDAEFNYDHFGLQGATIANESYIYNYCTIAEYNAEDCGPEGPATAANAAQIDGNSHIWSFTLNPTFTLPSEGTWGAYAVVGGGFYHKVTDFTTPTEQCSYYYGCGTYNSTFDHYTSNAFGVNGGFGVTYKFSKFSNERFYVEAKYVYMLNSQRTGVTTANVAASPLNAADFYPANSDRTSYIPVKVGIRF